jgi:hypothetical protein
MNPKLQTFLSQITIKIFYIEPSQLSANEIKINIKIISYIK